MAGRLLLILSFGFGVALTFWAHQALAQGSGAKNLSSSAVSASRAPASTSAGVMEGKESIDIRGQTRTLSMGLMIQSKKEKLRFVEPRRHYRDEILNTNY